MGLRYGKTEVSAMTSVLDSDYESVEDAARSALACAEEIFERRAQFVVVGQLSSSREKLEIDPSEREAIKVSLGWYSTEGDAIKAAESLWQNSVTGDRFRCWVLPVFHGTPAELHAKQKEKYAEAEAKREVKAREAFEKSIAAHRAAMEERASGGKGSCKNCGHEPYEHSMTSEGGKGRGECRLTDCLCTRWAEQTMKKEAA